MGTTSRYSWLKYTPLQQLVNIPKCDRCKKASEMASHYFCDCGALATLRNKHLGCHFMKPRDSEDIPVSKILYFAQRVGLLNELKGCTKGRSWSKCMGQLVPTLLYSILFFYPCIAPKYHSAHFSVCIQF